MRPCLEHGCPQFATLHGRCDAHRSRLNAKRNAKPERAIYKGGWNKVSKAARAEQGWCSVCMRSDRPLSLDHTTGLVVCVVCHRPDSVGGVRASLNK